MKNRLFRLLLLLISVALAAGCTQNDKKNFLGSGTLEAEEVIVSSLLAGALDSVLVEEGAAVEKGQLIALIDTSKLAAQLRQSEAALQELYINRRIADNAIQQAQTQHQNVSTNLERQKSLLQTGSSAQQTVDDLSAQEELARFKLNAARDQIAVLDAKEKQISAARDLIRLQMQDAVIRAPLSGSVIEKYVDAGENVPLGGAIVKIADLQRLRIKVYLAEKDVGLVRLNSRILVRADALPDHSFEGRVSWISPKAEFTPKNVQTRQARADLVFAVKVEFANPDLSAAIGMPADVYLP